MTSKLHEGALDAYKHLAMIKNAADDAIDGVRRMAESNMMPWRPISELTDQERYGDDDNAGFLLLAPELVDLDCNVHGVGMGFWQDDGLLWNASQEECDARDREKDYGSWMACKWSLTNDEWRHVCCTPTHYLKLTGAR